MEVAEIKQECEQAIECFMCKEIFQNYTDFEEHQNDQCIITGFDNAFAIKTECEDEVDDEELTIYECLCCGKIVNEVDDLVRHHKAHVNHPNCEYLKKSRCSPCVTEHDLITINKSREEKQCYVCSICDKKFTQLCHLNRHIKNTHTGEKPYACPECGKNFARRHGLKRHMLCHKGERPFICERCQKGFSQRPHLMKHMRTHSGERPFKCDVCNRSFGQRSTLERHQSTHTSDRPFSCDECNKRFSRLGSLQRHRIIHTGLRPFQCDVCKKCFNRASYLPVHKRVHEK